MSTLFSCIYIIAFLLIIFKYKNKNVLNRKIQAFKRISNIFKFKKNFYST